MKALLINLLVALSVALCGFNAYQWYREAKLHGRVASLGEEIFRESGEVQNLQQSLKISQDENKHLEGLREQALSQIKSNKVIVAQIESERDTFRNDLRIQSAKAAQVEQYKEAFAKANENLRKQNDIITTQNEKMKGLAEERNEIVNRLNKLATEYKSLGEDYTKVMGMYTNLVAQVAGRREEAPTATEVAHSLPSGPPSRVFCWLRPGPGGYGLTVIASADSRSSALAVLVERCVRTTPGRGHPHPPLRSRLWAPAPLGHRRATRLPLSRRRGLPASWTCPTTPSGA